MNDAMNVWEGRLAPEHLDHLAAAIDRAHSSQEASLAKAMEGSLDFVPKLLRGTVRKVLFG